MFDTLNERLSGLFDSLSGAGGAGGEGGGGGLGGSN